MPYVDVYARPRDEDLSSPRPARWIGRRQGYAPQEARAPYHLRAFSI
jgi:hypothetical protein